VSAPATPGQWLDALLGTPARLSRIETLVERLIVMAGESQAALTELGASISSEMEQFAARQEATEAQIRALLDQLGASQDQVDALDLSIAGDIRQAAARVRNIVPDAAATGGAGGPVTGAGGDQPLQTQADTETTAGLADPTDADTTASPVGAADDPNTPQGDTGGAGPVAASGVQVDPRDEYTLPRTADDGRDLGEADRPFTYDTGQPANGGQREQPVDPRGGVNDDYDQADPLPDPDQQQ